MRYVKYWMGLLLVSLLAACGGGGGSAGGSSGGTAVTPTPDVAALELLTSATNLASASANTVVITALVKNSANNGMPSTPVAFSADSGVLQSVSATTDASGAATATLSTGADRSNREIRVTVTSGGISSSVVVPVVGSGLSLVGVGSVLVGGTATYVATLRDSVGNPIPSVPISVRSNLGNSVSPAVLNTDSNGSTSFNYVANVSGNDVVSASGAGTTETLNVVVSGEDFSVVAPSSGTEVVVNTSREVRVRYRSSGAGVAGQTVSFSTTRGVLSTTTDVTDANGEAKVNVQSATAGPATVTAQIGGGTLTSVPLLFTALTPDTVVLQINPGAIPPNPSGSNANQARLQAVVRDPSGNPVKGRTVNFTLVADTSGGRIGTGSGTTDANGTVSDTFIPGPLSTAADGVRIRASVPGTDKESISTMTVSNQALFVSIATSNTIGNVDETTYSKPFSVQVNDANGTAVANQTVVLSVFPLRYRKGTMAFVPSATQWQVAANQWCLNEDRNRNGVLDPTEDKVANLSGNGNGRLEPGSPVIVGPGTVTTDSNGRATFSLTYGEQYAYWLEVEIVARTLVAGTESRAFYKDETWVLASDIIDGDISPAGRRSPFGTVLSCTNPD